MPDAAKILSNLSLSKAHSDICQIRELKRTAKQEKQTAKSPRCKILGHSLTSVHFTEDNAFSMANVRQFPFHTHLKNKNWEKKYYHNCFIDVFLLKPACSSSHARG